MIMLLHIEKIMEKIKIIQTASAIVLVSTHKLKEPDSN